MIRSLPEIRFPAVPEGKKPSEEDFAAAWERLTEFIKQSVLSIQEWSRLAHDDMDLARIVWAILSDANVDNVPEGGFAFEWDDPRAFVWARVNGVLRMLTNCPEKNEIMYTTTVQNDGTGKANWAFPLGGFKAATVPRIQATLKFTVAHGWQFVHQVSTSPMTTTNIQATVYFDEFNVAGDPAVLDPYPCTNTEMYADVQAMGEPP